MDKQSRQRFLGMPYDFRRPTWHRFKASAWNADSDRIIVPKFYGWGYDLNLHALLRRIGILGRPTTT